ncbi:MAG: haloacid dehalogenase-like hydrolase [Lachnospiraceae bacterium]|nr:haloacid dehalogenase-like hydrolase [Lachnospiraceae bacterium]
MNKEYDSHRKHQHIIVGILVIVAILGCVIMTGCGSRNSSQALTEYWAKDSAAADSLTGYVSKITNEKDAENYIPVEDRIAVFDMDGTLTCETYYTYYDTMMFINFCLEDHPERVSDELKEAAAAIRPGYTAGEELARNFAKAYAGMTVDELYDYAVEFGRKKTDSFQNMSYIDGFYLPMVEVVRYLYDNGFTIYVVSGTERTTTRAIIDNSPIRDYVAPNHVIGTEFEVKLKGSEDIASNMDFKYADGDELVFTGGFVQKNLNANKTIWIEREIGKRPVLAFGNSGSDTSMMNYTIDKRNPYPAMAFMVVADDDVREWGTQDWNEKSAAYSEQGYVPVSMKNDFLKIYPDTITRADVQYAEEELEAVADNTEQNNIIEFPSAKDQNIRTSLSRDGYTLKQAVVLSRHNIRSPLSGAGSALDTMTPYDWFEWSSEASQLSVKGGTLETAMGQYFRKWLESEGLFKPNYQPADGAVRIYANSKQRTIATARFFEAGLLPVAESQVEYHSDYDTMDPVFNPVLTYMSDEYADACKEEIHSLYDSKLAALDDNYALISEVIEIEKSEAYKTGSFSGFAVDDSVFSLEAGKEPAVSGSLKTACQISDALVLQYYEEEDPVKAAFGHKLSDEDWEAIAEIKDLYGDALFSAPGISVNVAHPLLEEIEKELMTENREFSFLCGHDSNLSSVLSAIGAEDYNLPYAIEKKTPIGSKLVISRWVDGSQNEFISLDLVYQTTEQLRRLSLPGNDNPPGIYSIRLKNLTADKNGLYKAEDVLERFGQAIDAYEELYEDYEQKKAS